MASGAGIALALNLVLMNKNKDVRFFGSLRSGGLEPSGNSRRQRRIFGLLPLDLVIMEIENVIGQFTCPSSSPLRFWAVATACVIDPPQRGTSS